MKEMLLVDIVNVQTASVTKMYKDHIYISFTKQYFEISISKSFILCE